jgi:ATP-dependent Lon protease
MKIIHPHGKATPEEIEELLSFAMECRRRVREHILRIDSTFKRNDFVYAPAKGGANKTVLTPEEVQYPQFAGPKPKIEEESLAGMGPEASGVPAITPSPKPNIETAPSPFAGNVSSGAPEHGHVIVHENTKGWSYRRLFAKHLKGAKIINISDPYIRAGFQVRNLMELIQVVYEMIPDGDEVVINLKTQSDPASCEKQAELLNQLQTALSGSKVSFNWTLEHSPNFHARSMTTDTGWKITIDRGLDIFQKYESGGFSLAQAVQEARLTRGAEISYLRV